MELWYDRIHVDDVIGHFPRRYRAALERDIRKARRKDHRRALTKLTRAVDGRVALRRGPAAARAPRGGGARHGRGHPHDRAVPRVPRDVRRELFDRFHVVDVARKVVGVGSVGTRCWILLLEGRDHPDGDRLVLQVKEAQDSVLEPYVGASTVGHHGKRVVVGQKLTHAASDLFLGWTAAPDSGRQYYVRQLWDVKGQSDPLAMDVRNLSHYGTLCAWALARAHARSGDAVQLAGYLGGSERFDEAIADFSAAYARTNERDHQALLAAIADGRIAAVTGI